MKKIIQSEPILIGPKEQLEQVKMTYKREQRVTYICDKCGKEIGIHLRELRIFPKVCVPCGNCIRQTGKKLTDSEKEAINEKTRKTCRERYGTNSYSQTNECREKVKQTCKEQYGVEHTPTWKYEYHQTRFDSN